MLTYANMNMKRTRQGYDARLCLKLVLNILKEIKGPTPVYIPLGDLVQGNFKRSFYVCIK